MHRTIFLSDVHLGSRLAKAEYLLDFLRSHDAETWYLVGDIYDLKRLRRRSYWPRSHARVIRALREKARAGQRLVYIPGNHDHDLRARIGLRRHLPGVEIRRQAIHTTARGRRLLVVHGDEHEPELEVRPLSYAGGCAAYIFGVGASELVGRARAVLGLGYWSLSSALKDRVLPRVPLMAQYRANVVRAARAAGTDGVVCGHIHHADAELHRDVLYVNCGDWVDSCTALVEDRSGRLHLLRWTAGPADAGTELPQVRPQPLPAW